jgi:hypothetical protein
LRRENERAFRLISLAETEDYPFAWKPDFRELRTLIVDLDSAIASFCRTPAGKALLKLQKRCDELEADVNFNLLVKQETMSALDASEMEVRRLKREVSVATKLLKEI